MRLELFLAKICKLSYYTENKENLLDLSSEFKLLGIEFAKKFLNYEYFDFDHVEGYFIEFSEFNVLVFRDTDAKEDWLYNLNYTPVNTLVGTVHKGYYDSVKKVWDNFLSTDKILEKIKSKRFYITGHSMGGSLAILTTYILKAMYIDETLDMFTYTFGSPKVFMRPETAFHRMLTNGLEKNLKHTVVNVINSTDIIPQLPLSIDSRVEELYYLDNKIFKRPKNFFMILLKIILLSIKKQKNYILESHRIVTYIKNLENV